MQWVLATAQLSSLAYAAAILARHGQGQRWTNVTRLAWTCAWILLVLHVALAFHLLHHWSHLAAWTHTAERTHQWFGMRFGAGIYANYAILVIWFADLLDDWRSALAERPEETHNQIPENYLQQNRSTLDHPQAHRLSSPPPRVQGGTPHRLPRWRNLAHAAIAFLQFQATIVFGGPAVRVGGLAVVAVWCWLAWRNRTRGSG